MAGPFSVRFGVEEAQQYGDMHRLLFPLHPLSLRPIRPAAAMKKYGSAGPLRSSSRRKSVLSEERPPAMNLVFDPVLAQRVPVDRGIDRDHRLAEPELGGRGDLGHREVGADLNHGIDLAAIHLEDRVAELLS